MIDASLIGYDHSLHGCKRAMPEPRGAFDVAERDLKHQWESWEIKEIGKKA